MNVGGIQEDEEFRIKISITIDAVWIDEHPRDIPADYGRCYLGPAVHDCVFR